MDQHSLSQVPGVIRQAPSKRSAALTGEAVEGIPHSRRGLLCLVLEIAGSVHHLGLHLLGFSLSLHRFIAAQGSGGGLQSTLSILSCGLDWASPGFQDKSIGVTP